MEVNIEDLLYFLFKIFMFVDINYIFFFKVICLGGVIEFFIEGYGKWGWGGCIKIGY